MNTQPSHIQKNNYSFKNKDLNPNVRQNQASNPKSSVWVGASAGTGKTKVLTDRVLRLLLPQTDGETGTPAHKILCLTFTKAGANEMALRINKTLGKWAVLEQRELEKELENLLKTPPTDEITTAARRLFAEVIDTPGGIQIMTIHSFCQSILGRFPLEAGLTPNFQVLDESQAAHLLIRARDDVLKNAQEPLAEHLYTLSQEIGEEAFTKLIQDIIKERAQFQKLLKTHFNVEGLYNALCQFLEIPAAIESQTIKQKAMTDSQFDSDSLRYLCDSLAGSTSKTDQKALAALSTFLSANEKKRLQLFDTYKLVFLKQDGNIRSTIVTKSIYKSSPEIEHIINKECQRLQSIEETIKRINLANLSHKILTIGAQIIDAYSILKKSISALDFDDMIIHTEKLLANKNSTKWFMFKLDQGLDHILVDEAQDTNPEQWRIIDALSEEFFSHENQEDNRTRTVFIVGDEKQSIYSFQRASPEAFENMRTHFRQKINQSHAQWNEIPLNTSFRTTKSVLEIVDRVFAQDDMKKGLGIHPIEHHSFRRGQAGLVELWPLFTPEEKEPTTTDGWIIPTSIVESQTPAAELSEHIASQIEKWIHSEKTLPSRNRAIQPGDIMILMRTRTALVPQITRALKNRNIPVSGADRMILGDQIAVQDLLAFAEFALLPQDDLTLACILKSPLIGWNEEQLYALAHNRNATLWEELQAQHEKSELITYLNTCIENARTQKPLEFFSTLLQTPCPADPITGLRAMQARLGEDARDPLDELLNLTLDFECNNIPTLQYFLHWQKNQQTSIKRELESDKNQVRIMTVHGSKGLQAPIVILPDTIRTSKHIPGQSDKRLLWPAQTGKPTPMWSPYKEKDPKPYTRAYEQIEARLDEEYKRLLYVAMTRAEDQLYITGHHGIRKPLEESWYHYIQNAMQGWDQVQDLDKGILRLENLQEQAPDRADKKHKTAEKSSIELPSWINKPAADEYIHTATLQPSHTLEQDTPALSPLESTQNHHFARGNLIHKILQFIPDITPKNRKKTLHNYLQTNATEFSTEAHQDIENEILEILSHQEYAPFFGESSQAEVSITGKLPDGRILSGQIDRLLVTDETIWILDFKTNRPPPKNKEDVPKIYIDQIKAYADTIREIYPGRTIKTALLWTYTARLMVFENL